MPRHYVAFHLGQSGSTLFSKVPVSGFQVFKSIWTSSRENLSSGFPMKLDLNQLAQLQ